MVGAQRMIYVQTLLGMEKGDENVSSPTRTM